MTGPLRKSATGAVHTLLRDSYSEPYFTSWCESPRNKCSRHSRVSATPFPRRGWWTRSSRRPRLPPYGPSRVQKPAQQKRPAALRRLSYVRKKRAVPRVLPPHTPRPDSATSSSAAPREPPGGAADSGADPGRRTHRPTPGLSARGPTLTLPRPHRAAPHRPFRLLLPFCPPLPPHAARRRNVTPTQAQTRGWAFCLVAVGACAGPVVRLGGARAWTAALVALPARLFPSRERPGVGGRGA